MLISISPINNKIVNVSFHALMSYLYDADGMSRKKKNRLQGAIVSVKDPTL